MSTMRAHIILGLALLLAPAPAAAQLMSLDMGTGTRGVATGATLMDVTLSGTTTLSGTLNANGNLVTNIGHSGTDFTSGGGLTLNGALTGNNGAVFTGLVAVFGDMGATGWLSVGAGPTTIGDGLPGTTVEINTAGWDISTDGIATGFTSLTASGALTSGSLVTGAITGTTLSGTTLSGTTLTLSGASTLTGAVTFGATSRFGSDLRLDFGSGADAATGSLEYDTGQTQDAFFLRVPETSRTVHLGDQGDVAYDYALAAQSNPTLVIHSANQSATQYNALSHSSTKATYTTGLGAHLFTAGSGNAIETASDQNILVGGGGGVYVRSTSTGFRENTGIEFTAGATQGLWLNTSRFQTEYATVASAGDLVLTTGNVFGITGTTQINAITTTNWLAGAEVTLKFASSVTVKNNTAGGAGTAVMLLFGGVDMQTTANDVLKLIYDGTNWTEVSRSVN